MQEQITGEDSSKILKIKYFKVDAGMRNSAAEPFVEASDKNYLGS